MKILREKIFSEKEKDEYKKRRKKKVAAIAGLAAGGTASAVLGTKVIPRKLEEKAAEEVGNAINKKLQNVGLQGGNFDIMDYMANREKHRAEMEEIGEKIGKKLKRNKTISKTAGIAGAGLAAGGLGYIAYKHYKNKKKQEKTKQFGQIGDRVQAGATLGLMTGVVPGAFLLKRAAEKNSKALAIAGLGTTLGAAAIGAGVGLYGGLKDKYRDKKSYLALEQALKTSNSHDINNIIKLRKSLWKFDDDTFGFSDYLKQKNSKLYNSAMNMDRSLGIEFFDIDVPEIDFCKEFDSSASPEKIESLAFDNSRLWDFLDIKIRLGDDIYKFNAWAYNIKDKSFELYNWCHRSFGNSENLVATCKSFSEFKNHLIGDLQNVAKKPTISDERCWDNMVDYCEGITTKDQFIKVRKDLWKYIQQYISEIINIIKKL